MTKKKKPQDPFHGAKPAPTGTQKLEVNGLSCAFNMPKALVTKTVGREEVAQGLPPYAVQTVYDVAAFDDACPEGWLRGGGGSRSYFVGVKPGHGLWLDFNANREHAHDVAVLVSIQGVNALTAAPTKSLEHALHQHKEGNKCRSHTRFNKRPSPKLDAERFCAKCGFKLPPQNYLATTGTPYGYLWLDGFRAKDGVVRQFVFTEDVARGIAAQVIGKDRVQALGIAFYLSKKPKPKMYRHYGGMQEESALESMGATRSIGASMNSKSIEVAAGAKIDQNVYADPKPIDYWETSPAGVIYINYADEGTVARVTGTKPPKKARPEKDALDDLVTGNDPE